MTSPPGRNPLFTSEYDYRPTDVKAQVSALIHPLIHEPLMISVALGRFLITGMKTVQGIRRRAHGMEARTLLRPRAFAVRRAPWTVHRPHYSMP